MFSLFTTCFATETAPKLNESRCSPWWLYIAAVHAAQFWRRRIRSLVLIFLISSCSACAPLMFCATDGPFLRLLVFCRWYTFSFIFVAAFTGRADCTWLGTRRAATSVACADVGAMRPTASRTPMTMVLPDTRIVSAIFLSFTTSPLDYRGLHLAPEMARCAFSFLRIPSCCSLRATMLLFGLRTESLFFFFVFLFFFGTAIISYNPGIEHSILRSVLFTALLSLWSTRWGVSHVRQYHQATRSSPSIVYKPLNFLGHCSSFTLTTYYIFLLYAHKRSSIFYCTVA